MFRHCLPAKYSPFRARPVRHTGISRRNSEHASTAKPTTECWSLAASDFVPGTIGGSKTPLRTYECKTGIYNMLEGKGQLHRSGVRLRLPLATKKSIKVRSTGQPRALSHMIISPNETSHPRTASLQVFHEEQIGQVASVPKNVVRLIGGNEGTRRPNDTGDVGRAEHLPRCADSGLKVHARDRT